MPESILAALPWLPLTILAAAIFAELAGYFIHRALHSPRFPFLSRNHMIHHLKLYGPKKPKRSETYLNPVKGRAALGNIGLEWLLPVGGILLLSLLLLNLAGIAWPHQVIFTLTAMGWGLFMFSYMHDALHIRNFWMSRNRFTRKWFLRARRLHDLHHMQLNDGGRMDTNFGICFFWFDRLFASYQGKFRGWNEQGLKQARRAYPFAFESEDR